MPATLTQVVQQVQQEWTTQLEPEAILNACDEIGYEWRDRCLRRSHLGSGKRRQGNVTRRTWNLRVSATDDHCETDQKSTNSPLNHQQHATIDHSGNQQSVPGTWLPTLVVMTLNPIRLRL